MTLPREPAVLDAILQTTEGERFGYVASVTMLSEDLLASALDEIDQSRTFAYLPAASLTVMRPPTEAVPGQTLGTLTVFRGGRIQWDAGSIGSLAQDWQVPHLYSSRTEALDLWSKLLRGAVEDIAGLPWRAEQTKLCPICGCDLAHLPWVSLGAQSGLPPFEVPAYETCSGCRTTFGVDWIGATFGEMRAAWLNACSTLSPDARASLQRTPTDHPLSAYEPAA